MNGRREDYNLSLSRDELEAIAIALYEEGFLYSEAYPLRRWRAKGWPEDSTVYKILDIYLKLFRAMEDYGIMNYDKMSK